MILCILWHHHLQIEQVVPGRPFQFTLEQDGGFCIEAQGEQWVIHLSSTLCFMDSRRRSRKIRSQHDELCYLPFYQKLDLYYYPEEAGFSRYRFFARPRGRVCVGPGCVMSATHYPQTTMWGILDFSNGEARETAETPGMIVQGSRQPRCFLHDCQRLQFAGQTLLIHPAFLALNDPTGDLKTDLRPLRLPLAKEWMSVPSVVDQSACFASFRFRQALPSLKLALAALPDFEKKTMTFSLYSVGPSLMMGAASIAMGLSMQQSGESARMMIVMPAVMVFSAVFWPLLQAGVCGLSHFRQRRRRKKALELQLIRMEEEIAAYQQALREELEHQFPSLFQLCEQILHSPCQLNKVQSEWLAVFSPGIHWQSPSVPMPEHSLSAQCGEDRKLIDRMEQWRRQPRTAVCLPVQWDLKRSRQLGVVLDELSEPAFLARLLLPLAAAHSPRQLRLSWIGPLPMEVSEWLSWLPLLFTEEGTRRIYEDGNEWLAQKRQMQRECIHELIVVAQGASVQTLGQQNFSEHSTLLQLVRQQEQLCLSDCPVISLSHGKGLIRDEWGQRLERFELDLSLPDSLRECALRLLKRDHHCLFQRRRGFSLADLTSGLPEIRQLWQQQDVTQGIRIPLGFDEQGNRLVLDLHERGQGPHGLIAGMTGSGKSVLLQTLVLSGCLHYAPDQLQFALIDYKGGSLAEQLKLHGRPLPHLIGTISNVDTQKIRRSLVYLQHECLRRQHCLLQAQQQLQHPVTDLDQYLVLRRHHVQLPTLAHLVVLIDEFAELRQSQPEFMQDLIQISRIGRSLGIHLILSTQRPAGVVDEQMWSNFNFKLCLRVAQKQDSQEMLHDGCAALLRKPGQFYLASGQQRLCGQGVWCNEKEGGSRFMELLDSRLKAVRRKDFISRQGQTQAQGWMRRIQQAADQIGFTPAPLWPAMPQRKPLSALKTTDALVLGEVDDPWNQRIFPLILDFDHALIAAENPQDQQELLAVVIQNASRFAPTTEFLMLDPYDQFPSLLNEAAVMDRITLKEGNRLKRMSDMIRQWLQYRQSMQKPLMLLFLHPAAWLKHDFMAELLLQLLQEGASLGMAVLLMLRSPSALPARYGQSIRQRYLCGRCSKLEMSSFFERSFLQDNPQGRNLVAGTERVLEFTLALPSLQDPQPAEKRWSIPHFPKQKEEAWLQDRRIYLGVDPIVCRPRFYDLKPGETLFVLSFEENLLNEKRKQLQNKALCLWDLRQGEPSEQVLKAHQPTVILATPVHLQSSSLRFSCSLQLVLWLGGGVEQQLLYPVGKQMISDQDSDVVFTRRGKSIKLQEVMDGETEIAGF